MSNDGERIFRLVEGLLRATESGRAHWKRTDMNDTYVLSTRAGSVTVSGPRTGALTAITGTGPSLLILDGQGEEVDRFNAGPPSVNINIVGREQRISEEYRVRISEELARLLHRISISKLHADKVTDGILSELGINELP